MFDWTRSKKIEMPQVKQERGDKKQAPGDVVWTRSKRQRCPR